VLWLYNETEPFALAPADKLTAFKAGMIACGLMDPPVIPPQRSAESAEVIDLAAVRRVRMGDGGPDA
jgi:hypothetical protein